MNEIKEINTLITKTIHGGKTEWINLQKAISSFFKNKKQEDFDKIKKENIKPITEIYDKIMKVKVPSETDKAFLEMHFPQKKQKYLLFSYSGKIDEPTLKRIIQIIHDSAREDKTIDAEDDKEFMAFMAWVLAYGSYWDDITLENKNKTLNLTLELTCIDNPEMNLIIYGTREYTHEKLINKLAEILKINQ